MPGEEKRMGDYTLAELNNMTIGEYADASVRQFRKPETAVSDDNVWARRQAAGATDSADFVVPSGQKCRLRQLTPEMLLPLGILDKVTRLEGMAQSLVDVAEGQPPAPEKAPSRADFELLLETINLIVPLAVEQPTVVADGAVDAPADAIRVSSIDLTDRVAIMEKALEKIRALDRFRHS